MYIIFLSFYLYNYSCKIVNVLVNTVTVVAVVHGSSPLPENRGPRMRFGYKYPKRR